MGCGVGGGANSADKAGKTTETKVLAESEILSTFMQPLSYAKANIKIIKKLFIKFCPSACKISLIILT